MVQLPQLMANIATIKLTKVITLSIMTQFLSNVFGFRISPKTPRYIELSHFSFSENGSFIHIFKIFFGGGGTFTHCTLILFTHFTGFSQIHYPFHSHPNLCLHCKLLNILSSIYEYYIDIISTTPTSLMPPSSWHLL